MKTHLGGLAYAAKDGMNVVLTIATDRRELSRIYLSPMVARALVRYITAIEAERIPHPRPDNTSERRGGAHPDLGMTAEAPAAADPRRSLIVTYPDGAMIRFEQHDGEVRGFKGDQCVIARPSLQEAIDIEGARHGASAAWWR